MLGLSIEKLAVLMLIAVILVGPDRLPGLVREAAQLLRKLRRMADDATRDLREEMGPEFADLRPQDLHPRALLQKHIIDPVFADDLDDDTHGGAGEPPRRDGTVRAPQPNGSAPAASSGPESSYTSDSDIT
ncbi:MAG TPA: sec-independent translocase [Mycobacteriales bacterium]|nr:sec-independent translocase [Mycobacteriales bacterium]